MSVAFVGCFCIRNRVNESFTQIYSFASVQGDLIVRICCRCHCFQSCHQGFLTYLLIYHYLDSFVLLNKFQRAFGVVYCYVQLPDEINPSLLLNVRILPRFSPVCHLSLPCSRCCFPMPHNYCDANPEKTDLSNSICYVLLQKALKIVQLNFRRQGISRIQCCFHLVEGMLQEFL